MGVSGCTACQTGSVEALQAYDRTYQARLNEEARQNAPAAVPVTVNQADSENRPIPGATVGGNINITA